MLNLKDFSNLINKRSHYECWDWLGEKDRFGRGIIYDYLAHVLVWEIFFGDLPEGSTLLHLCNDISCVNPYHLYIVEAETSVLEIPEPPKNFQKLNPGTQEWIQFWKEHPEQQEEMLNWKGEQK